MKKAILLAIVLSVSALPCSAMTHAEMCCAMEEEMEFCYNIGDYEGFNTILADWMRSDC